MSDAVVETISEFSFEEMFYGIIGMLEPLLDFLGLSTDMAAVQKYLRVGKYGIQIGIVGFLVFKLILTIFGGKSVRVLERRVSIDIAITVLKISFYLAMIYWTLNKKTKKCVLYEDDLA